MTLNKFIITVIWCFSSETDFYSFTDSFNLKQVQWEAQSEQTIKQSNKRTYEKKRYIQCMMQ